jgi:arginyl-tRNA synthetase
MQDLKSQLKTALENALPEGAQGLEVVIQDTPADKPGDYGSPIAFQLAKTLRGNPAQFAKELAEKVVLPKGVARAEAVGPYLNFFVDAAAFVQDVISSRFEAPALGQKVIIEHTSVNPNKEWHVGHIRGALIGDALGRIYRALGYTVEIQNYIDDTGRQAGESQFAVKHYNASYDGSQKYDHWLGELYVRLHKEFDFKKKDPSLQEVEAQIAEVIHALERGELRSEIERVVKSQLETAYSLGIEYDLLVWESDVVHAGFVEKALEIFGAHLQAPTEGKYAGTRGVDLSPFVPGLEEPFKVLVRGNGTYVYETKDIAYHYWKFGLFEGLEYQKFEKQKVTGKQLWSSNPSGEHEPEGQRFAHAQEVVNVIDSRQALAQMVVKAGLGLIADGAYVEKHHHLANETVLLEGQTMSGRKGITVSADEVIAEAKTRALAAMREISPNHPDPEGVAPIVGLGALKFAFLKAAPERQIDFRWDAALDLKGDTAVVVQYAHARIRSIKRKYDAQGFSGTADYPQLGALELDVLKVVAKYPEVLQLCIRENSSHPMCTYALDLAAAFNGYYNHKGKDGKPDTSVLHAPEGLREARLVVVTRVADAIRDALGVLGIEAPNEM